MKLEEHMDRINEYGRACWVRGLFVGWMCGTLVYFIADLLSS